MCCTSSAPGPSAVVAEPVSASDLAQEQLECVSHKLDVVLQGLVIAVPDGSVKPTTSRDVLRPLRSDLCDPSHAGGLGRAAPLAHRLRKYGRRTPNGGRFAEERGDIEREREGGAHARVRRELPKERGEAKDDEQSSMWKSMGNFEGAQNHERKGEHEGYSVDVSVGSGSTTMHMDGMAELRAGKDAIEARSARP